MADDALGSAQVRCQRLECGDQLSQGVIVLELEDRKGHVGGHVWVAVTIAPHPRPKPQRLSVERQRHVKPVELVVEFIEEVGRHLAEDLIEVVDRRPGLINRGRAGPSQLIGLPDQIDDLGKPAFGAGLIGRGQTGICPLLEDLGDAGRLGEDRASSRLCGMSREYRPQFEPGGNVGYHGMVNVGLVDPIDGGFEETATFPPPDAGLVTAMGLFGDVGEIEVGGEGSDQLNRGGHIESGQHLGQLVGGRLIIGARRFCDPESLRQRPHPFDEFEQLRTLLAHQALTQQVAQEANISPQPGVGSLDL